MGKEHQADLLQFLTPFPEPVRDLALWLREFVWDLYPECNELIYDNYNALAFGWGITNRLGDVFCSIAVYKSINFGFNRGSELTDSEHLLLGNGTRYRYVKVTDKKSFPKKYIKHMLGQAHAHAVVRLKPGALIINGETIVKSISGKKRRPQ